MNDARKVGFNMGFSPYQKALGYFVLLCLLFLVVVLSISLFNTYVEQPVLSGAVLILFTLIIGSFLLKVIYKQERPKHWYQQIEIILGLVLFCFIMVFITVSIFDTLFRAHPLKIVYYLEMATLFFWSFLSLFFIVFYLKNKFDEEKGEIEHSNMMEMEQKDDTKGQDQLKW